MTRSTIPSKVRRTLRRWRAQGIADSTIVAALSRTAHPNQGAVYPEDPQHRLNVQLLQEAIFQILSRNGSLTAIEIQRLSKALTECARILQSGLQASSTGPSPKEAVTQALHILGLESSQAKDVDVPERGSSRTQDTAVSDQGRTKPDQPDVAD